MRIGHRAKQSTKQASAPKLQAPNINIRSHRPTMKKIEISSQSLESYSGPVRPCGKVKQGARMMHMSPV